MRASLPQVVKHKHMRLVMIWGAILAVSVLMSFTAAGPYPKQAGSYQDIQDAYHSLNKYITLSGENIETVQLDASHMTSSTAVSNRVAIVTIDGDKLLLNQKSNHRTAEIPAVYKITMNEQVHQKVDDTIERWSFHNDRTMDGYFDWLFGESTVSAEEYERRQEEAWQWYAERIELLSDLRPLVLEEYHQSAAQPLVRTGLAGLGAIAFALLILNLYPLLLPQYSGTWRTYLAYGSPEADFAALNRLDIKKNHIYHRRGAYITQHFVVIPRFLYVFIAPADSLLWAYPMVKIADAEHGMPEARYVECWFTDGQSVRIRVGDKAEAAALSAALKEAFPDILAGFELGIYHAGIGDPKEFRRRVSSRQQTIQPRDQADVRSYLCGLGEEYQ